MFCPNCGFQISDDARFCEQCGASLNSGGMRAETETNAPAQTPPVQNAAMEGTKVTKNIYLCPDGMFRWIYEFRMMKNPVILFTILKIFGGIFGGIWLFETVLMLFDGFDTEVFLHNTFAIAAITLVILVIGLLSYVIVAAMNGWKYIVLFEMNDEGVTHTQMQKQFEKAQAIGWLTTMAGAMTGNLTTIGIGINTAVHNSLHSDFAKVRKIKVRRRQHTIHVNELLEKNQVYAEPEDFDFVLDHISKRIPADAAGK
ncbi:MAG: zinc ribbon domain-containing protein [Oscillospiraceae bacterium]|nr:zinc ribbon domain-containing protein [Oscillospiraceae bacterium]